MKALKAQGVVRSRRVGKMTMYALTGKGSALLAALEAGAE
jgi:predicted transcriptional regulator